MKIFDYLHKLGKEVTRMDPNKLMLHAQFCHKQLPKVRGYCVIDMRPLSV